MATDKGNSALVSGICSAQFSLNTAVYGQCYPFHKQAPVSINIILLYVVWCELSCVKITDMMTNCEDNIKITPLPLSKSMTSEPMISGWLIVIQNLTTP